MKDHEQAAQESPCNHPKPAFDSLTDHIAFYAFRYCLGRATYAVSDCVQYLILNWEQLRPRTRTQIQHEIRVAINKRRVGMTTDKDAWQRVLDLPLSES